MYIEGRSVEHPLSENDAMYIGQMLLSIRIYYNLESIFEDSKQTF